MRKGAAGGERKLNVTGEAAREPITLADMIKPARCWGITSTVVAH